MKLTNRSLFIFLVSCAAIVVVALFVYWPVKQSTPPAAATQFVQHQEQLPAHISTPVTALKEQPSTGIKVFDQRAQRIRTQMLQENKALALFGAVEDQRGRRVAGVKVVVSAGYYDGLVRPDYTQASHEFTVQTDSDGMFSVTGQQGISMYVTHLEKEGYLFAPAGYREFAQLYHLPSNAKLPAGEMNQGSPVVIPAWKRENDIALIREARALYTEQGQVERVKLKGTPMELEIIWTTPGTNREPGVWSVRIRAINGAIQATDDEFVFEAPRSGYQAEWSGGGIEHPELKLSHMEKKFYFVDEQHKYYGRLRASLSPYFRNENEMSFTYWINPTGERGLLSNTATGD